MKSALQSAAILSTIILVTGILGAQATKPASQPASKPALSNIETRFLALISEGKQSEAENLLEKQYTKAGNQPINPRVVFLTACCLRSRFMVEDSYPIFKTIAERDGGSVEGQCAIHILYLDSRKDVEKHFEALRKLADDNPDDLMLRWMVAVQCRTLNKNEEGVKHYKKLLEKWNPGPVLVHQTYANLLDELNRFDEALVERRKAVELDPAPWCYQGLGNTLASMNKFQEANEAYAKSVELAPEGASYWRCWAWGLERQGNFDEAIVKAEKAIALNPKEWRAWNTWGWCLKSQGKHEEAIAKFRKALEINPDDNNARTQINNLEKKLKAQSKPSK